MGCKFLLVIPAFLLSSHVAWADSTSVAPPATEVHVDMKGYTVPGNLPSNVQTFIQDPNNMCQPNEARLQCFMQYTATLNSDNVTYSMTNTNIQCPPYYNAIAVFGTAIFDMSSPLQPLYYYNQVSQENISVAQYQAWVASGATCTPDYSKPDGSNTVITGGTNLDCCVSSNPSYIVDSNGIVAIPGGSVNNWEQDTWMCGNGGNSCSHYTLAGCPAWCAHGYMATQGYYVANCLRPAGIYPPPAQATGDDLANRSTYYTPSTVICSKTTVEWHEPATPPPPPVAIPFMSGGPQGGAAMP